MPQKVSEWKSRNRNSNNVAFARLAHNGSKPNHTATTDSKPLDRITASLKALFTFFIRPMNTTGIHLSGSQTAHILSEIQTGHCCSDVYETGGEREGEGEGEGLKTMHQSSSALILTQSPEISAPLAWSPLNQSLWITASDTGFTTGVRSRTERSSGCATAPKGRRVALISVVSNEQYDLKAHSNENLLHTGRGFGRFELRYVRRWWGEVNTAKSEFREQVAGEKAHFEYSNVCVVISVTWVCMT